MPTKNETSAIIVNPIRYETIGVTVLGTRLLFNRVSEKAKRELLLPSGPKNAAARAAHLKHDPLAEFRASAYTLPDPGGPTHLAALAVWFKRSMQSAALRLPGLTKTAIGQLIWSNSERLPVWGVPKLHMATTRNADIGRTPDVRTRCILPEWTADVEITYVVPLLNQRGVLDLLIAAGMIAGVGDDRQEKGHDNCGAFELVNEDDPRVLALKASGGRDAQVAAMATPAFYDDEAEALFRWFDGQVKELGRTGQLASLAAD